MLDAILEIVNLEDLATESMTFILENDIAEELVDELVREIPLFYEDSIRDVLNVLDENAFVSVTINRYDDGEEELFVEPLIHDDGEQFVNECDLFFIQEELLDVVEEELLEGDIYVMYYEDEEYEDEDLDQDTEEFLEDVTEELIEKLLNNDGECVHCMIKDVLRDMWETGYQDCIIDIMDED